MAFKASLLGQALSKTYPHTYGLGGIWVLLDGLRVLDVGDKGYIFVACGFVLSSAIYLVLALCQGALGWSDFALRSIEDNSDSDVVYILKCCAIILKYTFSIAMPLLAFYFMGIHFDGSYVAIVYAYAFVATGVFIGSIALRRYYRRAKEKSQNRHPGTYTE